MSWANQLLRLTKHTVCHNRVLKKHSFSLFVPASRANILYGVLNEQDSLPHYPDQEKALLSPRTLHFTVQSFLLNPRQRLKARGVLTLAIRCQAIPLQNVICQQFPCLLFTELYNCSYTWVSERMNTDFSSAFIAATSPSVCPLSDRSVVSCSLAFLMASRSGGVH